MSGHELVNPPGMAAPVGFAHGVVAAPGRAVHLGGQTAAAADGSIVGETVAEQYDLALANVVEVLRAAGARPEHLVSMTIYTTDMDGYRTSLRDLGAAHRRHLGRHYPATALFGVSELFDPLARVEVVCVAVIPDGGP